MPTASALAPRLTYAAIVTAAEQLVAAHGVDGLSMRKLAKACDVGVMTLYGYVRTKDELLAGLAERALAGLEFPATTNRDWTYRVAAVFHTLRRALLAHPELVPVVAAGRLERLSASRAAELFFAALGTLGLDDRQSLDAFRALTSFTVGACQRELGLAGESSDGLGVADFDAEFAAGLDLLITGLRGWVDQS